MRGLIEDWSCIPESKYMSLNRDDPGRCARTLESWVSWEIVMNRNIEHHGSNWDGLSDVLWDFGGLGSEGILPEELRAQTWFGNLQKQEPFKCPLVASVMWCQGQKVRSSGTRKLDAGSFVLLLPLLLLVMVRLTGVEAFPPSRA